MDKSILKLILKKGDARKLRIFETAKREKLVNITICSIHLTTTTKKNHTSSIQQTETTQVIQVLGTKLSRNETSYMWTTNLQ